MSSTGIKYLNIDKGYKYVARVYIKGKSFVIWSGYEFAIGKKCALKAQELMNKSETDFLEWYDYGMKGWLTKNGCKNENK